MPSGTGSFIHDGADGVLRRDIFLVFLQVATSGIVFVFADVIEPVLYSTLFDGLQNSELSGFLTACAISMVILLVMLAIQYLNDVVLDANVFYAINEMSIRSCEEYHRIPFLPDPGNGRRRCVQSDQQRR